MLRRSWGLEWSGASGRRSWVGEEKLETAKEEAVSAVCCRRAERDRYVIDSDGGIGRVGSEGTGTLSESDWLSSDEALATVGPALESGASREKSSMLAGSDGVPADEGERRVSLLGGWLESAVCDPVLSERRVSRFGVDRE